MEQYVPKDGIWDSFGHILYPFFAMYYLHLLVCILYTLGFGVLVKENLVIRTFSTELYLSTYFYLLRE